MISCFRCGLILWCWNPGFWKTELARIQTLARHKVLGLIWLENLIILKIIEKKIHLMCNEGTWKFRVFTSVFDLVIQIRFILSRWVISQSSYIGPNESKKSRSNESMKKRSNESSQQNCTSNAQISSWKPHRVLEPDVLDFRRECFCFDWKICLSQNKNKVANERKKII